MACINIQNVKVNQSTLIPRLDWRETNAISNELMRITITLTFPKTVDPPLSRTDIIFVKKNYATTILDPNNLRKKA